MKSLTPLEYDWLCALGRKDMKTVFELSWSMPGDESLFKRGLYTYTPYPDDSNLMIDGQLTQAGRDALMCYQALMKGSFP